MQEVPLAEVALAVSPLAVLTLGRPLASGSDRPGVSPQYVKDFFKCPNAYLQGVNVQ